MNLQTAYIEASTSADDIADTYFDGWMNDDPEQSARYEAWRQIAEYASEQAEALAPWRVWTGQIVEMLLVLPAGAVVMWLVAVFLIGLAPIVGTAIGCALGVFGALYRFGEWHGTWERLSCRVDEWLADRLEKYWPIEEETTDA